MKVCTIEKSESMQISVGSNAVRIGNTIDSLINMYTTSAPLLYSDNRNIVLGPHNASYDGIWNAMKKSRIEINKVYVGSFSAPILINCKANCFTIQAPIDFRRCAIPNITADSNLLLAPQEYIEQLNNEKKVIMGIQKKIKESNLSDEQINVLHQCIQGQFKEWLVKTPQFKSIVEFVKLIDQSQ